MGQFYLEGAKNLAALMITIRLSGAQLILPSLNIPFHHPWDNVCWPGGYSERTGVSRMRI